MIIKRLVVLGAIFLFLISGCEQASINVDCVDHFLEKYNLIRYQGQDTSDRFLVELYMYEGASYFIFSHPHIDIALQPISCDGEFLCGPNIGTTCENFSLTAELIGIVGVSSN